MQYVSHYLSPLGNMLLSCDDIGLTGLWFEGQKYFASKLSEDVKEEERQVFKAVKEWLDMYFQGKKPTIHIPLHLIGTAFEVEVWQILGNIPYGNTQTYGELAKIIAQKRKIKRMSAQGVGRAVGHNPISIILPCHRVIGANGILTGYAGGLESKYKLLTLEGVTINDDF